MHRNRVNGKVYIGMTSMNLNKRWANGNGYSSCRLFNRAIKKYGWDNFDHLILYDGLSFEDACYAEKILISKYDSTNHSKGYNLTSGGEACNHSDETKQILRNLRLGKPMPETAKQKLRDNYSGENAYWYGKQRSRDTCAKISAARQNVKHSDETKAKISHSLSGQCNYWHGRHLTDEHKKKIALKNSGKTVPKEVREKISKSQLDRGGKSINQYSLDGQFLRNWKSISQAAKGVCGDCSHLAKCCKKNKPAYGYIWRYSESE